ncbi:unnamed protein product [Amoebophrya sp. A120]|nr:unnamed protein product [Amoebophrya sp. A120]|eukprot:GSA120T00004722001.1
MTGIEDTPQADHGSSRRKQSIGESSTNSGNTGSFTSSGAAAAGPRGPANLLQIENVHTMSPQDADTTGSETLERATAANVAANTGATASAEDHASGGVLAAEQEQSSPSKQRRSLNLTRPTSTTQLKSTITNNTDFLCSKLPRLTIREWAFLSAFTIWTTIIVNSLDNRKDWWITPPLSLTQHDYLRGQMIALFGFGLTATGMFIAGRRAYRLYFKEIANFGSSGSSKSRGLTSSSDKSGVSQISRMPSATKQDEDANSSGPLAKLVITEKQEVDPRASILSNKEEEDERLASTAIPSSAMAPTLTALDSIGVTNSVISSAADPAEVELEVAEQTRRRSNSREQALADHAATSAGAPTLLAALEVGQYEQTSAAGAAQEQLQTKIVTRAEGRDEAAATSTTSVQELTEVEHDQRGDLSEMRITSATSPSSASAVSKKMESTKLSTVSAASRRTTLRYRMEQKLNWVSNEWKIRIIFGAYMLSTPFLFGIAFIVDQHDNEVESEFLPVDRKSHQWMSRVFFTLQLVHQIGLLLWTWLSHDSTFHPAIKRHYEDKPDIRNSKPLKEVFEKRRNNMSKTLYLALLRQKRVWQFRIFAVFLGLYGAIIGFFVLEYGVCASGCSRYETQNITGTNQYLCILGTVLFSMTHAYDPLLDTA